MQQRNYWVYNLINVVKHASVPQCGRTTESKSIPVLHRDGLQKLQGDPRNSAQANRGEQGETVWPQTTSQSQAEPTARLVLRRQRPIASQVFGWPSSPRSLAKFDTNAGPLVAPENPIGAVRVRRLEYSSTVQLCRDGISDAATRLGSGIPDPAAPKPALIWTIFANQIPFLDFAGVIRARSVWTLQPNSKPARGQVHGP